MKVCEHCGVYVTDTETGICRKCQSIGIRKSNTAEQNQAAVDNMAKQFHRDLERITITLTGDETPSELAAKLIDKDYVATLADVPRDLLEAELRDALAENARYEAALNAILSIRPHGGDAHSWAGGHDYAVRMAQEIARKALGDGA